MSQQDILNAIVKHRAEQDVEHGGPAHDDLHTRKEWTDFINQQLKQSQPILGNTENYRERLIKIAALAVAALESDERLEGPFLG